MDCPFAADRADSSLVDRNLEKMSMANISMFSLPRLLLLLFFPLLLILLHRYRIVLCLLPLFFFGRGCLYLYSTPAKQLGSDQGMERCVSGFPQAYSRPTLGIVRRVARKPVASSRGLVVVCRYST